MYNLYSLSEFMLKADIDIEYPTNIIRIHDDAGTLQVRICRGTGVCSLWLNVSLVYTTYEARRYRRMTDRVFVITRKQRRGARDRIAADIAEYVGRHVERRILRQIRDLPTMADTVRSEHEFVQDIYVPQDPEVPTPLSDGYVLFAGRVYKANNEYQPVMVSTPNNRQIDVYHTLLCGEGE